MSQRSKQIFKAFLLYILPVALVLDFFCMFVSYDADYYFDGNRYSASHVSGFPFPDNGLFYELNGMFTSGNSTTNWSYYFANKVILLTVAILICFFVSRKLVYTKARKIIGLCLLSMVYLFFGWVFFIITTMRIQYEYGRWPDKLEIREMYWKKF
jgi:hypothetical protein